MVGKTVSHYRIVRQLGAGGMGVVYEAEDPRLNRQVALKFVPDDLASDAHTLARLRSEARTASGLNHPNICTIYDIGEFEGRPFIVMELLKGQTLRERMETGRLKIQEAVDVGIQAADGLFWAHGKDVIHRDIKPANLFLCEQGPLKILDFGLAKVMAPQPGLEATIAPTVDLTAVGVAMGTVAYMSPEQVSGDKLDRRTDLFSLGVVLYECLTGQQPFQGKTSAVILASILTQNPTPPIEVNGTIPVGLQDVIHTCLEKDRELRYQDAGSLRADLKRVKRDLESGALGAARSGPSGALRSGPTGATRASSSTSVTTAQLPFQATDGATGTTGVVTVQKSHGLAIGLGVAAAALAGALIAVTLSRNAPNSPAPQASTAPLATGAAAAPPAVQAPAPPAADVDAAASRRADSARFDDAIVEGNRLLAAGDGDGASRALAVARAIDPGSPAVADLSGRIVEHFRRMAAQKPATEPSRPGPPPARPAAADAGATRANAAPPVAPQRPAPAAASVAPQVPAQAEVASAAVASGREQTGEPPRPVASSPAATPPAAPRPETTERRPPATTPVATTPPPATPAPAGQDDDAAIRRVVASYARAIETKDLALYRSVKPNLSASEQRTIEDAFRAVTSQHITVAIQSIDRRGQDAVVVLRRHDVVEVSGRQQTADTQQTLRLTKSSAGWVIREIGR